MDSVIRLEHGSGGALSRELIDEIIYPRLRNVSYPALADATSISCKENMCFTTDSFVIDPVFFPGGDIGKLAVYGTCNDLAVSGAAPKYLSLGFILEEGFPIADLIVILDSIAIAVKEVDAAVVTGDTKVVPSGKGGGMYINTAGVGELVYSESLGPSRIGEGDAVILSGPIGAHGMAVMAAREGLPVGNALVSDCANLSPLCSELYALGSDLRFMRDATRGGIAAVLNELAAELELGILVREESIPIDENVGAVARILGISPLDTANEGVFVAVVESDSATRALDLLLSYPVGQGAAQIGVLTPDNPGRVYLETTIGGRRILDLPRGLLLPRIC